jgi:hypothetical protein
VRGAAQVGTGTVVIHAARGTQYVGPDTTLIIAADLPLLRLLPVEDMEAMTPNERLEAVAVRTVTSGEDVTYEGRPPKVA